jgi:hypothetical protein
MNLVTGLALRANDAMHEALREMMPCKRRVEKLIGPIAPTMQLELVTSNDTFEPTMYRRHVECTQVGSGTKISVDITVDWTAGTADLWVKVNGADDIHLLEERLANGYRATLHYINHPEHDAVVESVVPPSTDVNALATPRTLISLTATKPNTLGGSVSASGTFMVCDPYPSVYEQIVTQLPHPSTSLSLYFNPSIVGSVFGLSAIAQPDPPPSQVQGTRTYLCVAEAIALDALHCDFACTATFAALNYMLVKNES